MTEDRDADRAAIADGADKFAQRAFGAARLRALKDGRDGEALRAAGGDGWLGLALPESEGGAGQGLAEASLVAQAFGKRLAPLPFAAQVAALRALAGNHGDVVTEWREAAAAGERLIVPALASGREAGVRLDAEGLLHGERRGAFGMGADAFLVPASGDEPALVLVARDAEGLRVDLRPTVDGLGAADLSFDGCRPLAVLARGAAAQTAEEELRAAAGLLAAAEMLGVMDGALALTLEHLKTRQQFGKPLGAFQALQFRAVDAYVAFASSRALVAEAARLADSGAAGSARACAAAKAKTAEAAIAVTRAAVQMHGAIGFSDEHDVGLFLKRAMALASAWGTARDWRRPLADDLGAAAGDDISFRADSPTAAAFRQEVRAWLAAELPEHLRNLPTRPTFEDAGWWHRKLAARGWAAPNWPKEYGGMGAEVAEQIVLYEEFGAAGAPEISGQAIYHLGPILQIFGTPEQKARHLPGMVSGETVWCQGYSEPGAGSDLASLRTRATRDGDHLVVNGSKIWTTWGHYADWMFALVRTNPDVKKQEGITFLLIDMTSPGITRRPIRTLTGEDEFAEVFFDNVRVPVENVVGEIDGGWKVANAVLEKERLNGANPTKCAQLLTRVKQAARRSGRLDDPGFRDRLAEAQIDFVALCATFAQIVNIVETGSRSKGDFAYAKLVSGELQQRLCELLFEACGADAASAEPIGLEGGAVNPGVLYLQNRRVTIYGGSSEIQRLLIARRVLGLGLGGR